MLQADTTREAGQRTSVMGLVSLYIQIMVGPMKVNTFKESAKELVN